LAVVSDLKSQPGAAGDLHLGLEPEQPMGLKSLNSPKIKRISDADVTRVPSATADTDSANQQIEKASELPEPVRVIPAIFAADLLDRCKRLCSRYIHGLCPGIDDS
jgi:hypothetical protein